jgi:biopolymer transport protein ExbD
MGYYKNNSSYQRMLHNILSRTQLKVSWVFVACFLPVILIYVFLFHISETETTGGMWIGVKSVEDKVVIITEDKRVFFDIDDFAKYLREKFDSKIAMATLKRKFWRKSTKVVIALDRDLKFENVRPLIGVLADVGVTDYAFEARLTDHE